MNRAWMLTLLGSAGVALEGAATKPDLIAATDTAQCGDDFFARLYPSLAQEATGATKLSAPQRSALATALVEDAEGPAQLSATLRQFYAADGPSVQAVLAAARSLQVQANATDPAFRGVRFPFDTVTAAYAALDGLSQQRYGKPFHVLSLLKKSEPLESSEPVARLAQAVPRAGSSVPGAANSCPENLYPRYIGPMWPWKLVFSTRQQFYSRKLDSGCNVHMEYFRTLRGWVGFSPSVFITVAMNAWGGVLAANESALFIKWWTLAPFAFFPPLLALKLWGRKV